MSKIQDLPQLISQENWSAATAVLKREAGKSGAPAHIFYNLAKVLQAGGKWKQSGKWLRRAILKDSNYQIAWFELGRWALEYRELQLAYEAFRKSSELNPDDTDAKRNAARLALRLGKWAQAREYWQAFTDIEAEQARYRIAAELGENIHDLRAKLLANQNARPEAIKTMTRTAKGSIPLRL